MKPQCHFPLEYETNMPSKPLNQDGRWWSEHRWTLGFCAVMGIANAGLFTNAGLFAQLIDWLLFDRQAIPGG